MGSPTKTISYRYDSRGNRSALIDHDGGRTSYTYDVMNRLTQVINPQGERTSFSYDAGGRRTVKKLANGTRASFTCDAASNLTKLGNLKSDGTVISSFDYKYDKVGNRRAVLEADGSRVTWSYDDADQLTGEHRTGANPYRDTYTYDPAGNRLLKNRDGARTTYAYDAANQLTYSQDGSGRTTFTFDADGNQQVVREPSGNRTTYAWDYENRLTSVRLPSGIRNTMAYDADGLRVNLEESTGTKKFVWDDQNYLGETDAANDTQVVYTNEPLRYGNLVSQRRGSTSHWYHFDALGSTRQLTDASAIVSDTRLYDAWGNAVATSGSTVSPLQWVGGIGYYFDSQTGLYYVRARMYQPVIAQWVSVDPVGFLGQVANLYTYAWNAPHFVTDASGYLPLNPCDIPGAGGCTYRPCPDPYCPDEDYCACCTAVLDSLRKKKKGEGVVLPKAFGECQIDVSCSDPCPGPRRIPGYTWPREPNPNGGRLQFLVRICISCHLDGDSIERVVEHELIHARRFCRHEGIADCATCKVEEGRAYEVSCRQAFPNDRARQRRCKLCGILASCSGYDNGTCRPANAPTDCTPADLGVGLVPGCRFYGNQIVCS